MRTLQGLIVVVLIILLAGCALASASPTPPATEASAGAPFSLRVGEAATVGDLTLTLTAIENDSRCPTEVSCVWEGSAEALVNVAIAGQAGATAALTLYGQNRESEESRREMGGYTIRLTALEPYPAEPGAIPPELYVATFVIEEGGVGYTVGGLMVNGES